MRRRFFWLLLAVEKPIDADYPSQLMPDFPPPALPPKVPPLVWGAILIVASLAFPTWKFGHRFLLQFFISPFQFFILPLWLLAYFGVRNGRMPMRSGPPVRRDQNPSLFRQNL